MKFSEFVQLLYPIIGAGNPTHAFTRSLYETIVTEEGQSILEDYSAETFKAYYNGNTSITRLAQKVIAYIEPEEFCGYIAEFSDATIQNLCNSFEEYIPGITLHNASEMLAEFFVAIIKEAASAKKKTRHESEE